MKLSDPIPEHFGFSISQDLKPDEREDLYLNVLAPLSTKLQNTPSFALFYFTYHEATFKTLTLRVLGQNETWKSDLVLNKVIEPFHNWARKKKVPKAKYGPFLRETQRYGGSVGVALAEQIFFLDSCFCLDFLRLKKNNPKNYAMPIIHLLLADTMLKHLGFSPEQRIHFFTNDDKRFLELKATAGEALLRDRQKILNFVSPYFEPTATTKTIWKTQKAASLVNQYMSELIPLVNLIIEKQTCGQIERYDVPFLLSKIIHARGIRLGIPHTSEVLYFEIWQNLLKAEVPCS